ncbi:MAG: cysteine--tRNA ligase [Alphaproteobacteria bacterium CG_4_10_14_0_8_um_filter_37_21]|nr:MAG: cysteine--tRNA ligase [Alphaproteobacteria bacterium CG_4_10_14_0_8_um_filter_37_21]
MPDLKLYNSRTRKHEKFIPLTETVRMYVCGPTVYDLAHLGNARPVVVFDIVFRLLKTLYKKVVYARNITDVDDKIIDAAAKKNISITQLTVDTTKQYHEDMQALNTLQPTHEPRATDHIEDMITMIETLIKKEYAYAADGHVLFCSKKYKDYGRLSNRSFDEQLAGARVEVATYKQDASDFVLWKPTSNNQPGWKSPWGYGRPGWHIECSAMSKHFLSDHFDIHGGGIDLIFPHHENEIAQSCCANGSDLMANFWLHNGHLTVDGEKMSKSLGNFLTVRDLLKKYPGEAIRLALLTTHYRQPSDFSDTALSLAKATLDRFYTALKPFDTVEASTCHVVLDALCDDINTPLAISHLHELVKELNKSHDPKIAAELKAGAALLGLLYQDHKTWFQKANITNMTAVEIENYIQLRAQARKNKDFKEGDRIRDALLEQNIVLEDSAAGTTWKHT